MSKFRYTLADFHAIKEADIIVDGITVLAGENGCGKSTLAKWLYYLVNAANGFGEFIWWKLYQEAEKNLNKPNRVRKDIAVNATALLSYSRMLRPIAENKELDLLLDNYHKIIDTFETELENYIVYREEPWVQKLRVLQYLDIAVQDNQVSESAITEYCDRLRGEFQQQYLQAKSALNLYPTRELNKFIEEEYSENEPIPSRIQFYEGEMPLLDEQQFRVPYTLRDAIYIDTPMALSLNFFEPEKHWEELWTMMMNKHEDMPREGKSLLARIRKSIGGRASVKNDITGIKSLRYQRADGLDIELKEAATGIKSFACIQRLLENGYLDSETILLIDEPEAHLHPQWIVEFARLLVLLYKDIGLKIMIASHNPDMVAAIQSIARKEGVLEDTHFYQAYREKGTLQYRYKDLGGEVQEIFESFNIAISRIQDYGADSVQ